MVGTNIIGGDRLTQNSIDSESKKNPGAGWLGGLVKRAQIGFRIQVRAECGKNVD